MNFHLATKQLWANQNSFECYAACECCSCSLKAKQTYFWLHFSINVVLKEHDHGLWSWLVSIHDKVATTESLDNWEICMIKIWISEVRQYYSFKVNHSIVFNNNLDANLKTRWKHQYCFKTMSKAHLIIAYSTIHVIIF